MTSRRIDQLLLGFGFLIVVVSSYQLFFKTTQGEQGLTLGTLASTFSVVKTKNPLSLDWRDAISGHEVGQNQLIYTDQDARAEIKFSIGGQLEIGENSLVRLQLVNDQNSLNLTKGMIRAKIEEDKPLKIQMNGENFIVSSSGADVQINLVGEKGEIGVLSGKVNVEAKGLKEELDTKTSLAIDGKKTLKKNIYFKDLSPNKNKILYTGQSSLLTPFLWSPKETAKILLTQRSRSDETTIFEGESGLTTELLPGSYSYQVENDQGTSLVEHFQIVEEVSPEIIRPLSGSQIEILDKNSFLHLQWKDEGRHVYLLEWNDGVDHSEQISGSGKLIPITQSGTLKWRLKISSSDRPLAKWSLWQEVQVKVLSIPSVPSDLSPHEVEFQTYAAPQEKIEFRWKSEHVVEFEVIDPRGQTITKKIEGNSEIVNASIAGSYRWRVRALDNFLRQSDWSEWKTFVIEDLSHEVSTEGVQRIQLKKPDQTVTFNWESAEGAVSVFELSKDPTFETVVKRTELAQDQIKVSVPETGSYYWRSRQFLPNGTIHVSEPKRVIIEPVPAPNKPDKLPDLEVPIQESAVKTSLIKSILDFILANAYADELKGEAQISLPTKEDAKAFVVRIYRDIDLTDLVFEKEIMEKNFTWRDAVPGTYYWQYAVIDYWDRKSLFSDPAILKISGELIPAPEKPRLLSPIKKTKIDNTNLAFEWTSSKKNANYKLELASDRKFQDLISTHSSIDSKLSLNKLNLKPGLYFWKITAFDKKGRTVTSNTGRFVIKPPLEKKIFIDQIAGWNKIWKKRLSLSWNPSMDSYVFKDNEVEGNIDGNVLMGASMAGTYFHEHGIINAEILRQSGKVFEDQEYLFQRFLIDYIYSWNLHSNHKWGIGLALGQTSGQTYEINVGTVSSKAESGLNYGVILRNYLSFNETWEMQGKLQYLTGDISQIDLGADALYHLPNYFLLGGLAYSMRSYGSQSNEQSSIKLSLGIGREF